MNEQVQNFFLNQRGLDGRSRHTINQRLKLGFKYKFEKETLEEWCRERAQFLFDLITHWQEKLNFFCNRYNNEGQITLQYKTPSTCGSCVNAQTVLDKIFGSRNNFNSLMFVKDEGGRSYSFCLDLLEYFAENGEEATLTLIESRKREDEKRKIKEKRQEQLELFNQKRAKLNKLLDGREITPELERQVTSYLGNNSLQIISPDVAVVITERSDYARGSCIAYYDQVRVFYGDKSKMKEWQWRDHSGTCHNWLRVEEVRNVEVREAGEKVHVVVNGTTYTFDVLTKDSSTPQTLSLEDQATFSTLLESAQNGIMEELNRFWECKGKMLASYPAVSVPVTSPTYVRYTRPSIKQTVAHLEIGIAAFVTEEQIDHRLTDPAFRHELFILSAGGVARCKFEDQGYVSNGGALITILSLRSEEVDISVKGVKKTIPFD